MKANTEKANQAQNTEVTPQSKRPYIAPRLQDFGTVAALTGAGFGGTANEGGFSGYLNSI